MSVRWIYSCLVLLITTVSLSCGSGGGGGGGAPAAGNATLSGTVQYEDKEYGITGFTLKAGYYKPVRYAMVEILDASNGSTLATGVTGPDGHYSIVFPYFGTSVSVRVLAETKLAPDHAIEVDSPSGALYGVVTSAVTVTNNAAFTKNIVITASSGAGGAFNILDVCTAASQFVHSLSGAYPPSLKTFWQAGADSSIGGTYYCTGCPSGDGIYIGGGTANGIGDTDEYDDDVLWHEFGHFIASKFSRDDSPGGYHYLNSTNLDLRLAWSEGWGDFFPGAIKNWLWNNADTSIKNVFSAMPPPGMALSYYIDTVDNGSGGFGISFDMGNPGPQYIYASSEVAVAKVLLDLRTAFSMQHVWNTIASINSSNPAPPLQVNLEAFWDTWGMQNTPGSTESAIFTGRSIYYAPDAFEPADNSVNTATAYAVFPIVQTHTLYPAGDFDYLGFAVDSSRGYTITTGYLTNGADTFMRILGPDKAAEIARNDNENSGTLSSRLVLPVGMPSGTYYVEVSSSPSRPLSSGRYGSYTISVTSP